VPSQLRDLGVTRVTSLLPWNPGDDCKTLSPEMATAVFGLPGARPGPARPRLGITIEAAPGGVRIASVAAGSVAEATGLRTGDVLVEAAGAALKASSEVRAIVERVAPGTWLPLKVLREGRNMELVARFPPP
jgi:S1-C subfamily serine protease